MIIRRHVIDLTAHLIGNAVIENIDHDIEISTADGIIDNAPAFTGTVARTAEIHKITVFAVSLQREIDPCQRRLSPHLGQILVDNLSEFPAAFQRCDL